MPAAPATTSIEPGAEGVDADEAVLVARLRLAVTRLHRRLRQQSAGGLTQSQASALASIDTLGAPTLGALAAREAVQPPSMTRIVAALEELGYVTRVSDERDRRVARVTLTPLGSEVLERGRSLRNAYLAERVGLLSPQDREALEDLTGLLERLLDVDRP
ncbi:MAG: MarR family winged helix-turn-helix transcriptional regulator [Acidimicrobiales bacterium]